MSLRLAGTLLAVSLAAACGGDGDGGGGFDDRQIITDFADQVVVPTYQLLDQRSADLHAAAQDLNGERSEATLEAAKAAWVELRVPWEQSEGFLFGPVSAQGWDPAMDSWPLNKDDLNGVLASEATLDQEYIRGLSETLKGFHTVEYLLWGENSEKPAEDLTAREMEYLLALTEELTIITGDLATSWTEGVGGEPAYREVFVTAGEPGSSYPSQSAAAQEILDGMSGICDEVANGKIAEPYDSRDPNKVESQYSFNSLYDFQDNMRSVLNAFTGDFPAGGTTGRGLDEYVAERDADLEQRLKTEIQAAIDALGAIPAPFRTAITDSANDEVIEAAQQAIATVQDTVDGDLADAVLD